MFGGLASKEFVAVKPQNEAEQTNKIARKHWAVSTTVLVVIAIIVLAKE
jgi:hypothetical protein